VERLNHSHNCSRKPVIGPAPDIVASILTFLFEFVYFKFSTAFSIAVFMSSSGFPDE
jgi:hypothetical protein